LPEKRRSQPFLNRFTVVEKCHSGTFPEVISRFRFSGPGQKSPFNRRFPVLANLHTAPESSFNPRFPAYARFRFLPFLAVFSPFSALFPTPFFMI